MEKEKQNVKEIVLIGKTYKTKEGKAFTAFKAVTKEHKLIDCKFRQKDSNGKNIVMPSASCVMVIDASGLSLNRSGQYPVLWVREQPEYKDREITASKAVDETF